MRKSIFIISVLFSINICAMVVFAHSGKTDGAGGHMDHSTGYYHYHHGYPEHDHYDIDGDGQVDCPYNFVDSTDYNYNNNSGDTTVDKNSSVIFENDNISNSDGNEENIESNTTVNYGDTIGIIFITGGFAITAIIFGLYSDNSWLMRFFYYVGDKIGNYKYKKSSAYVVDQQKIVNSNKILQYIMKSAFINIWKRYNRAKGVYDDNNCKIYSDLDRLIPENTVLDCNGLPMEIQKTACDDRYTFRLGSKNVFHTESCRYATSFKINAFSIRNQRPCKICKPVVPDVSWVSEYKKVLYFTQKLDKLFSSHTDYVAPDLIKWEIVYKFDEQAISILKKFPYHDLYDNDSLHKLFEADPIFQELIRDYAQNIVLWFTWACVAKLIKIFQLQTTKLSSLKLYALKYAYEHYNELDKAIKQELSKTKYSKTKP